MRLAVPDRGWPRNGSHLESGHRPAVFRVDLAPADRKRAAGVEGLLPALSGTGGAAWRGLRAGERELACKPRLGRPIGPDLGGTRCPECRLGRSEIGRASCRERVGK